MDWRLEKPVFESGLSMLQSYPGSDEIIFIWLHAAANRYFNPADLLVLIMRQLWTLGINHSFAKASTDLSERN